MIHGSAWLVNEDARILGARTIQFDIELAVAERPLTGH